MYEIRGDELIIYIHPCIKRPLERDLFKAVSNDDQTSVTVAPAVAPTRILFGCKKHPVRFQVGYNDILKMVKWPSNKVKFESDPRLDGKFPKIEL